MKLIKKILTVSAVIGCLVFGSSTLASGSYSTLQALAGSETPVTLAASNDICQFDHTVIDDKSSDSSASIPVGCCITEFGMCCMMPHANVMSCSFAPAAPSAPV